MSKIMAAALALAAAVGLGCDKKKAPEPGAPATGAEADKKEPAPGGSATPAPVTGPATALKYADTANLWAMAPPEATFGFVVADGVGPRALEVVNRARGKLQGKPFAAKLLAKMETWRKEQPFDVFDAAAYKTQGWDISKGVAVFGGADTSDPLLIVMPVTDIEAFRKTTKDTESTVEKVGDRDVLKTKKMMCTAVATRFVCGPTLEAIDAAAKAHDSSLAAAVKALPADARGDIEGYVDVVKTPEVAKSFIQLRQVGDFTTAGGALRIDAGGMNLQLWAKGAMSPLASGFASTPPPSDLAALTANATTVMRMKFDPKLLLLNAPPSAPVGDADARTDLLDQLTGDVQVVTAGTGLLAGAVMLKINDATKVKKMLAALCAEAKKGGDLPVSGVVAKEDSCSGEILLASLKQMIGVELPPFKFNFVVTGQLLIAALGDIDIAALKGSVVDEAASAEAKDTLTGAQTVSLWTRGLGIDVGALPKELADKVNGQPDVAEALAMLNWTGGQAYELSASASVSQGGVKMTLHVTSMEADAADAHAAYDSALDKKISGDRAGYSAALADIEKKFPASLAARRAKLERAGTPIVGPVSGMMVGAVAGFYFVMRAAGGALTNPGGGSFGEPAPGSPPEPPSAPSAPTPAPEKPPEGAH